MPTARLLQGDARQVVPDLPGYGASQKPPARTTSRPSPTRRARARRDGDREGGVRRQLDGLPHQRRACRPAPTAPSGSCCAPAGGPQQPAAASGRGPARDRRGAREPRMAAVARSRLRALRTDQRAAVRRDDASPPSTGCRGAVPALECSAAAIPCCRSAHGCSRSATQLPPHVTIAIITGAAHAINFSTPASRAHVIRCWLAGEEITDDPDQPVSPASSPRCRADARRIRVRGRRVTATSWANAGGGAYGGDSPRKQAPQQEQTRTDPEDRMWAPSTDAPAPRLW